MTFVSMSSIMKPFSERKKEMPNIQIKTGSATAPQPENGRGIIIAHIANDVGAFGAGFVLALNKVSLAAKMAYQGWAQDYSKSIPRGLVQIVELKPNVFVANMIAQQGIDKSAVNNGCLVDYKALDKCLKILFDRAIRLNCDIHIPAGMGSGLAGGDRTMIHQMIRVQAQEAENAANLGNFDPSRKSDGYIEVILTLWEFTDTSSDSFVAPPPHPVTVGSPGAPIASQSVPDSILGNLTEDDL